MKNFLLLFDESITDPKLGAITYTASKENGEDPDIELDIIGKPFLVAMSELNPFKVEVDGDRDDLVLVATDISFRDKQKQFFASKLTVVNYVFKPKETVDTWALSQLENGEVILLESVVCAFAEKSNSSLVGTDYVVGINKTDEFGVQYIDYEKTKEFSFLLLGTLFTLIPFATAE